MYSHACRQHVNGIKEIRHEKAFEAVGQVLSHACGQHVKWISQVPNLV